MSRIVRAWAKDSLRGGLLYLLAVAIVAPLGCVLILLPTWLALNLSMDDTTTALVVVVPALLFLVLVFGGMGGVGALMLVRRKRWLDNAFGSLGLTGSTYALTGRQYHGVVDGRQVDVLFYRGPTLDIHLSTPLKTRFGISEQSGDTRFLAGLLGQEPLTLEASTLSDLGVYALDEPWTRTLLADPRIQTLLQRLFTAGQEWALIHVLRLDPERFSLRLYRNKNLFKYGFTPEEARQWLDDLLALARIAENLPAPQATVEMTSTERLARSPQSVSRLAMLITLAILLGLMACSAVAVVVGLRLGGS